jgi:hypothetical protein
MDWKSRIADAAPGLIVVLTLALVALAVGSGCKSLGLAASVPSDQKSATLVVTKESMAVMLAAIAKGEHVGISSLESVPEQGSGFYSKTDSYLIGPDGQPLKDKDGNPLAVSVELLTKVSNIGALASLEGVGRLEYTLNGYDYVKDLPPALKSMISAMTPCQMKLIVEGAQKIGLKGSTVAENRAAAAAERTAIFAGLSAYADAQGKAFATKVDAIGKGFATISTSLAGVAGTVAGQILKTTPAAIPANLLADGVTKLVNVVLRKGDGTLTDVLAADTATAKDATTCDGCSEESTK